MPRFVLDRRRDPLHGAVLLDGRQRAQDAAGADAGPAHARPETFVWQNFFDAVNYIPFFTFAFNSLIITLGITIGAVLSNTLVAYGFSRIDWPGRDKVFYVCLATIFLPYPVIIVALFDIFGKLPAFGLQGSDTWVNTFLPLIIPAFLGNPFYIFLMRQFMMGISRELTDAAKVDGANEFQVFWRSSCPSPSPPSRSSRSSPRSRRGTSSCCRCSTCRSSRSTRSRSGSRSSPASTTSPTTCSWPPRPSSCCRSSSSSSSGNASSWKASRWAGSRLRMGYGRQAATTPATRPTDR